MVVRDSIRCIRAVLRTVCESRWQSLVIRVDLQSRFTSVQIRLVTFVYTTEQTRKLILLNQ